MKRLQASGIVLLIAVGVVLGALLSYVLTGNARQPNEEELPGEIVIKEVMYQRMTEHCKTAETFRTTMVISSTVFAEADVYCSIKQQYAGANGFVAIINESLWKPFLVAPVDATRSNAVTICCHRPDSEKMRCSEPYLNPSCKEE